MANKQLKAAMAAFDRANTQDPHRERIDGKEYPRELWYAQRLTRWVKRLQPKASDALLLAARCQHIERWKIPRKSFPPGRGGYLRWRHTLANYHAQRAGEILIELGYAEPFVRRVQELNLKQRIKGDPETQVLEDALCLVFLEDQLHDFANDKDESTMLRIIRKTWKKMSPLGHNMALELDLQTGDRELIEKALGMTRTR